MWIKECVLPRNQVRAVVVGTVEVLVGTGDDVDRRAAVKDGDGRYRPMIRKLTQEGVRALVVVEIPYAGDAGGVTPVIVRRASLFLQMGEVLRGRQPDSGLVGALERMAQDIEAVQHEVVRQRPVSRDLEGMIGGSLVGDQKDVLPQNAWIVRTPHIDAGLRCGGSRCIGGVVIVNHDGQIMRQRSDIGNCGTDLARQLTLNSGVDLVDQGHCVLCEMVSTLAAGRKRGCDGL